MVLVYGMILTMTSKGEMTQQNYSIIDEVNLGADGKQFTHNTMQKSNIMSFLTMQETNIMLKC